MSTHRIPDALRHFDSLPDSAGARLPVVMALYGASASTIWRRVRTGEIPAPTRRGRITTWNVGDLRRHLAGDGV